MEKINLQFTQEQLAVIDAALGALPYRQAAPLINDINRQIGEQLPIVEAAPGEGFDLTR